MSSYKVSWPQRYKPNFVKRNAEKKNGETYLARYFKNLIIALDHIHNGGILHNDLKANNVVLEKLEKEWNPVIIDFGKARFALDPKPAMSLAASEQEEYRKRYPHIASELVCGTSRQSFASDIFSLGRIVFAVLDLLPAATSKSLKVARAAMRDDPEQRPSLKELLASL